MVSTCQCFARPGILGRRSPRGVKISPHFGPGDCETSFRREVPREATSSRPRSACFLVSTVGFVIQLHHFARPAWVPNGAGSAESAFNDVACATPFEKVGHRETSYSSWPSVNGATFFLVLPYWKGGNYRQFFWREFAPFRPIITPSCGNQAGNPRLGREFFARCCKTEQMSGGSLPKCMKN